MSDLKKRTFSRREMLRLSALGAGGVVLAACAPQTGDGSSASSAETMDSPAAEPEGEVIFWGHDQHPLDLAGEGFEAATGVKWVSPHPADRGAKLQAALAANADCPDVFWMEASQINDLSCVGALLDITEHLNEEKDQYHPLKLAEATQPKDGKFYGWPGDISVSGWYYRADLMEELGYGDIDFDNWTWSDFFDMSADIAEQGKYTFVFPGKAWTALYMYALHQVGGSVTDESGLEITVNDEKGLQAMEIVKGLSDSGGGLDVDWWSPAYWAALQDGTIVGDFAAAWAKGFWEAQIETAEQGAGKWRLGQFPGGQNIEFRTGIWGGATLVSLNCSSNKENAIAYMKYALGSEEGANLVGGWGIVPAYRPYLESEDFTAGRSPIFGDWAFNEFWASQEQELSTKFYRRAGFDPINTAIGEKMPSIMDGEVSIEQGMNEIAELAAPDVERVACT
ncbi:MAG: extracellular solute-binding protein [Chloroflexota bacterium]